MTSAVEPFYLEPEFWVGTTFIAFIAVAVWFGAHKALAKGLDARAAKVKAQLDEAERLKNEAAALLASYEAKRKQAEADAKAMLAHAAEDAEILTKNAEAELEAMLARRARMAEQQIAQAEASAIAEVRKAAVTVASAAAAKVIAENLDAGAQEALIAASISGLDAKPH